MHFLVDANNIIENFHIEKWDSTALGQTLIDEINAYSGKNYEEFILFALKKKLFLKLRILYSMGPEESITFWWESSPIYGINIKDNNRTFDLLLLNPKQKYAKFYLKIKGKNLSSVCYESGTSKHFVSANREAKCIAIELCEDDAVEISNSFNISRNNDNCIYFLASKSENEENLYRGTFEGIRLVVINKVTGELQILTPDAVESITPEILTSYAGMISTIPHNQNEAAEMKKILDKIKIMNSSHKQKWYNIFSSKTQ